MEASLEDPVVSLEVPASRGERLGELLDGCSESLEQAVLLLEVRGAQLETPGGTLETCRTRLEISGTPPELGEPVLEPISYALEAADAPPGGRSRLQFRP